MMTQSDSIFHRSRLLLGNDVFIRIGDVRVILFGIGGVGSWTAEALIRSGIRHLTLVDADVVAISNINRQLPATTVTVGRSKCEVLAERLLEINPEADIEIRQIRYTAETADQFDLDSYHYVIDAIDSLSDKALLILNATRSRAKLFSSMGAALKLDPTRIGVAEFWNVKGCPLAAALRRKFKKSKQMPRRKFKCVYSDELLENHPLPEDSSDTAMTYGKVASNGALCHITAIFGMTLAGLLIKDAATLVE